MLENLTMFILISFIVYAFYAMGIEETNIKDTHGNKL